MNTVFLASTLSLALSTAAPPPADAVTTELEKLRGIWTLVREVEDGKDVTTDQLKKTRLTFGRDGKWKVEVDGKLIGEGTAVLDPGKKPKTIDYRFTGGDAKGAKFIAIYELEGDTFRHCGVLKGERPTEFSSKPGSGHTLTEFRREKK